MCALLDDLYNSPAPFRCELFGSEDGSLVTSNYVNTFYKFIIASFCPETATQLVSFANLLFSNYNGSCRRVGEKLFHLAPFQLIDIRQLKQIEHMQRLVRNTYMQTANGKNFQRNFLLLLQLVVIARQKHPKVNSIKFTQNLSAYSWLWCARLQFKCISSDNKVVLEPKENKNYLELHANIIV